MAVVPKKMERAMKIKEGKENSKNYNSDKWYNKFISRQQ